MGREGIKVIALDWSPNGLLFSIHCTCDTIYPCLRLWGAPVRGAVKCPTCRRSAPLSLLVGAWKNIPAELMERRYCRAIDKLYQMFGEKRVKPSSTDYFWERYPPQQLGLKPEKSGGKNLAKIKKKV